MARAEFKKGHFIGGGQYYLFPFIKLIFVYTFRMTQYKEYCIVSIHCIMFRPLIMAIIR